MLEAQSHARTKKIEILAKRRVIRPLQSVFSLAMVAQYGQQQQTSAGPSPTPVSDRVC
jgi:hypothetical protein